MINTGYRPSEAAGLKPEHIRLDHAVPHISIEPVERELKNKQSKREIPLVGISLEAFRACPEGFGRYRGSSASLSATVNKYLASNRLLESDKHVMYSLRHAFEDRMIAAKVDERIRADLFGHKLGRPRYGEGASLEHKREVIQSFAL
jgi:integrase